MCLFLIVLFSLSASTFAQIDIVLRKSFIDSLKNKVTIDANYKVVKMHKYPNTAKKDGDMHIAGYADNIDLPVVAEIMNAKDENEAVNILRTFEDTADQITIKGAWRIWCEHTKNYRQDQYAPLIKIKNTNPDHVFEIHPITMIQDRDILNSLKGIDGYSYKEAAKAFERYSKIKCRLQDLNDRVLIETKGVGYNYAEFHIEITDSSQLVTDDGRFIICKVKDKTGKTVYEKMRMVFPKNSEAEKKVKVLGKGDTMHVLGIPRVDLALVSYRIKHSVDHPYMLGWNLPVEMIIVADLAD